MDRGLSRRTFVRGTAGAVGMGAVGALSSKLQFVAASEPSRRPDVQTITVDLVPIGNRFRVQCEDKEVPLGDDVEWQKGSNVESIVLVAFKGRSPFRHGNRDFEVLEPGGPGTKDPTVAGALRAHVPQGAEIGTYSYTIVVQSNEVDQNNQNLNRKYPKDPDLFIVPN